VRGKPTPLPRGRWGQGNDLERTMHFVFGTSLGNAVADKILDALQEAAPQRLTLYIPNKDCQGTTLANQDKWVKRAHELLTAIGKGASAFPPVDGS
jgi:ABC-type Zn2+ transport system substrate-binding protein/surface adhesin